MKKSMSGLNRIITRKNSPVNFMGQNPGGESFPTFPSGGYAHGSTSGGFGSDLLELGSRVRARLGFVRDLD